MIPASGKLNREGPEMKGYFRHPDGMVKVWLEHEDSYVIFCVWNEQEIPQEITKRIFQRNFSTKEEAGRGIGTFSMKLLGENVLGGHVNFSTSKSKGTIFKFSIPT